MTSIRAFSEILGESDLSEEDRLRYAGIIAKEATRLTRLLDDLLDLSVLENGGVQLDRRQGILADVLDQAVAAAGIRPDALRIQRRRSEEGIPLDTDLDRLAQVFINIIANAQKYCTNARPVLRIEVGRAAGATVVDFIDNGEGIPPDKQEMIFEKFSRLTDHAKAGGAGLGLAICREIMLKLGGSIAYLPGQGGAAFRVTLPQSTALAAE
jgi:signal transduction histidine kinase